MQQKHKLETVVWKKPRKWNAIKDEFINNSSKSQVLMAHSFWVICRNVSRTFVVLCMETPYWCTVLVHQYGRWKSTRTSGVHFFYKSSFFHSRTRIPAYKHIFEYLKWLYCWRSRGEIFSTRQHSYFGVTQCENSKFKLLYFRNETYYGNGNLFNVLFLLIFNLV